MGKIAEEEKQDYLTLGFKIEELFQKDFFKGSAAFSFSTRRHFIPFKSSLKNRIDIKPKINLRRKK